jgi:beta-galactosidase
MSEGLTRRELMGTGTALGLASSLIGPARAQVLPSSDSARADVSVWSAGAFISVMPPTSKRISASAATSALRQGGASADAARPDFDDSGWALVQVPHDWAVALRLRHQPLRRARTEPTLGRRMA